MNEEDPVIYTHKVDILWKFSFKSFENRRKHNKKKQLLPSFPLDHSTAIWINLFGVFTAVIDNEMNIERKYTKYLSKQIDSLRFVVCRIENMYKMHKILKLRNHFLNILIIPVFIL